MTLASTIVVVGVMQAQAQNTVYTFDNFNGDDAYTEAGNWDLGAVPVLSTAETANLAAGDAVTYTPGGDLIISNGGVLEVSSGSFTQVTGNNYIQLGQQGQGTGTGNGTILVNGGTFNQGTDSATPFALTGTGNALTVTAGTANITSAYNVGAGLSTTVSGGTLNVGTTAATTAANISGNFAVSGTGAVFLSQNLNLATTSVTTVSGGTINVNGGNFASNGTFSMSGGTFTVATGHEFDFNSTGNTLSGGTIITPLITGTNAPNGAAAALNLQGGMLQITGSAFAGGVYEGGNVKTQPINFTLSSTAQISFTSGSETMMQVQNLINTSAIQYNDTVSSPLSDFTITQNGTTITLTLASGLAGAVPEPSSIVLTVLGVAALAGWMIRGRQSVLVA